MALLSVWSCQKIVDDFKGATVLSEISTSNDGDLISKLTTNWIPGHLFKDVSEDYVVFFTNRIIRDKPQGWKIYYRLY